MLYNILESFMIYHYMHVYTHIHHHTVCIYIYIHMRKFIFQNMQMQLQTFPNSTTINVWMNGGFWAISQVHASLAWLLTNPTLDPQELFLKQNLQEVGWVVFPLQKGVFYVFFLKKWQINAISYLCYSVEQIMHQKNTHGIWVFDELQTSQLYVSCSAGSSDVQPFCSFLPRKTTEKLHKKSLGDFKMSAKWIRTAREISITPQIRLCFVPFFSFWLISFLGIPSIFSIFLCVCGFMPHLMLFFRIPFFHPPVFPWRIQQHHLGYPTAPGLFRLTPCCLEVVQSLRVTNTPSERQMWQIWLLGRWQPRNERAWWCEIPQETWWIKTLRQPKKKTWYPVAFFP